MITLATLRHATAQQVFDQVVGHLLQQGMPSRGDHETFSGCRYRLGDLKCAAGCLIADDEYSEAMEGKDWDELAYGRYVPTHHQDLIEDLQAAHDLSSKETDFVANFCVGACIIAARYELNTAVLDDAQETP